MWPKSLSCRTWVDQILRSKFRHPSPTLPTLWSIVQGRIQVWSFKRLPRLPGIYGAIHGHFWWRSCLWESEMSSKGHCYTCCIQPFWLYEWPRRSFNFKAERSLQSLWPGRDLSGGCQLSHGCANCWLSHSPAKSANFFHLQFDLYQEFILDCQVTLFRLALWWWWGD